MENNDQEFIQWQKDVKQQIKEWTSYLSKRDFGTGKSYQTILTKLNKEEPDFPPSYHGTTEDIFNSLVRNMFEDAKKNVRDIALKGKAK